VAANVIGQRLVYFDGQKSIALEQYPEAAWTTLVGSAGETAQSMSDLFANIAWLRRGVDVRANAVSSMPFAIVKGDQDFDNSTSWTNAVGFMPNPKRLLWLIEASLTLTARAYLFRESLGTTSIPMDLRYMLPTSVTPVFSPATGLVAFNRAVGNIPRRFEPNKFVYFWAPDPYVEIGPSSRSPAQAAMSAAGVLYSVDRFAELFFRRGAIKATILAVSGSAQEQERKRLREWWQQMISGLQNAWKAEVVNADTIKATTVGEGLEGLHNQTLTREKREDISAALGIPQTLLFSDAATNATAMVDQKAFLAHTGIPECEFIAEVLNEQVFDAMGLRMEFRPETLEAFQEDEAERSTSLAQLVTAGLPLVLAMEILGFDLTADQWDALKKKQAEPKPPVIQVNPFAPKPAAADVPADVPVDVPPLDVAVGDQWGKAASAAELRAWERFALRRLGKSGGREFESNALTALQHDRIAEGLREAKSAEAVRALFARERQMLQANESDVDRLASALLEASAALRETVVSEAA
jgi:HK97 family phage portal protein